MNTAVMYYTCLCVSIVLNLKNISFHVLIVVVFKYMRNTNCFTIILNCITVSNRRCDPADLPFLFCTKHVNAPFYEKFLSQMSHFLLSKRKLRVFVPKSVEMRHECVLKIWK